MPDGRKTGRSSIELSPELIEIVKKNSGSYKELFDAMYKLLDEGKCTEEEVDEAVSRHAHQWDMCPTIATVWSVEQNRKNGNLQVFCC